MNNRKIFGIFSTNLLIWFHYILLVGALFGGFYLGESYLNLSKLTTIQMFIFWFVVLSISDQLIHKILRVD